MIKHDDYTYEFNSQDEIPILKRKISDLRAEIAWYHGFLKGVSSDLPEDSQVRENIEKVLKEKEEPECHT